MKRALLATTVILPITASMAFAGNYLNVDQSISNSTQSAGNTLSTSINSEDLEQAATNVANLVDQAIGGGTVDQSVKGLVQGAVNTAETNGRWRRVDQDAANLSNILQGDDFGEVTQSILKLDQGAHNSLVAGAGGGISNDQVARVNQNATNVGNLVSTEGDTDDITQSVGGWWWWWPIDGADQVATNSVTAGGLGDMRHIDQVASNLLNIVQMDTSGAIEQTIKHSSQGAYNEILQGAAGPFNNNEQTATNVGNLIDGDTIGAASSQQAWNLPQSATNIMNIAGNDGNEDVNTGDYPATALEQTATNLANIAQLGDLDKSLTQYSKGGTQSAYNEISRTADTSGLIRLEEVTQTATNATNLVTAGSVGGGSSLVQTSIGLNQSAWNSISGVSSAMQGPTIQAASNLSNVLTGN